ncbi:MAG: hypothetical protein KGM43_15415 [Planctomycetota bacterium]|nr:hypothetical protein [Planctomycetota bacterium]
MIFDPQSSGRVKKKVTAGPADGIRGEYRKLGQEEPEALEVSRIFLYEPGWRVALKAGSGRVYCYVIAPGDDHYHRLADGEIYLHRGDEKVCLACAGRRGLLSFEPRALRDPALDISGLGATLDEGPALLPSADDTPLDAEG